MTEQRFAMLKGGEGAEVGGGGGEGHTTFCVTFNSGPSSFSHIWGDKKRCPPLTKNRGVFGGGDVG